MKKLIKFLLLSTILLYSSSHATIWYYWNHPVNYTSPWLTNLWWTWWPNRWTLCTDDWGWDWSNNKLALWNSSTTTDPETWLIFISPSWTMRCLYYDATPPNWDWTLRFNAATHIKQKGCSNNQLYWCMMK